jgi:hypothetical protein
MSLIHPQEKNDAKLAMGDHRCRCGWLVFLTG